MHTHTQSDKRTLTVFGATGNQGNSVVNALLKDGTFAIRAITRDNSKNDSKELSKKGVQVCQGDITASKEQLVECMKGSYGVFLMTDSGESNQQSHELTLGKKMVDAARDAGVKHVIWSTLPNVAKISGGKYNLPPFTEKAEVEDYIRLMQKKSPKAFEYVTFVAPSFFYENFDQMMAPKKEGDTWVFNLPRCKNLVAFDVDEIGPSVLTAMKNPAKYDMKRIDYYGDNMPLENYIKTYEKVTGRKTRLNNPTTDELNKAGMGFAAQLFGYINDFGFYGQNGDQKSGIEATPGGLSNYETYLRKKRPVSS